MWEQREQKAQRHTATRFLGFSEKGAEQESQNTLKMVQVLNDTTANGPER